MSKMADFVAVKGLLDELTSMSEKLTPGERDLVAEIAAKYEVPGSGAFDDKLCLEVILRNVSVRARFGLAPAAAAERRIDLGRQGADED